MTAEMIVGNEALDFLGEFEWAHSLQTRYRGKEIFTEWVTIHPDRLLDEGLARHHLRVFRRGGGDDPFVEYRVVRRPVGEMEVLNW